MFVSSVLSLEQPNLMKMLRAKEVGWLISLLHPFSHTYFGMLIAAWGIYLTSEGGALLSNFLHYGMTVHSENEIWSIQRPAYCVVKYALPGSHNKRVLNHCVARDFQTCLPLSVNWNRPIFLELCSSPKLL